MRSLTFRRLPHIWFPDRTRPHPPDLYIVLVDVEMLGVEVENPHKILSQGSFVLSLVIPPLSLLPVKK